MVMTFGAIEGTVGFAPWRGASSRESGGSLPYRWRHVVVGKRRNRRVPSMARKVMSPAVTSRCSERIGQGSEVAEEAAQHPPGAGQRRDRRHLRAPRNAGARPPALVQLRRPARADLVPPRHGDAREGVRPHWRRHPGVLLLRHQDLREGWRYRRGNRRLPRAHPAGHPTHRQEALGQQALPGR